MAPAAPVGMRDLGMKTLIRGFQEQTHTYTHTHTYMHTYTDQMCPTHFTAACILASSSAVCIHLSGTYIHLPHYGSLYRSLSFDLSLSLSLYRSL